MPSDKPPLQLVAKCEEYFETYGDSYLGVAWTQSQDNADTRYRVMLDVIRPPTEPVTLLDLGCGLSHLYEFIGRSGRSGISYAGLDLSPKFLDASRAKFPDLPYYDVDLLERPEDLPSFDYVVMNGLFTARWEVSYERMRPYFEALVAAAFDKARVGLAFNVMSKQVDWERDDLFHVAFDDLAAYLVEKVSRNFVLRHDYGLYEYTVYVYR